MHDISRFIHDIMPLLEIATALVLGKLVFIRKL